MTDERQIDYDLLLHSAFREAQRGVMRTVLARIAEEGLPGEHHFYISFHTQAEGVAIAPRLLQKYAKEMTIVLQHRFWDLIVQQDRFEVKLTFDGIRERLVIPFAAVRMFFDPSVPYGLQFEDGSPDGRGSDVAGYGPRSGSRHGKPAQDRGRASRKSKAEQVDDDIAASQADEAPKKAPAKATGSVTALTGKSSGDSEKAAVASTPVPGPMPKQGPRLVETPPSDGAKVVSLDQFRKK